MNLWQLLRTPRYWTHASLRWIAVIVFLLGTAAATGWSLYATGDKAVKGVLLFYGVGLVYLWSFFFSAGLLPAADARQLRLPGIERQIHASLLLYGVLSLLLPMLIPGITIESVGVVLLFLVGGVAFALMPRYLAVLLAMTPSLLVVAWRRFDLPGIADPRFGTWAALAALALLLVTAWRWHRMLRTGSHTTNGWGSPIVLQLRSGSWGYWSNIGDNSLLRQRPDWMQPGINLDGAGPNLPRKSLRVALGGWYLPLTARTYAGQIGLMLLIVALPVASTLLLVRLHGDGNTESMSTLAGGMLGVLSSLAVMAGPMICIFSLLWLGRRWRQANAEMPLLALLPGLGDGVLLKQQLLRTVLTMPLVLHAASILILLPIMVSLSGNGDLSMLAFMLLTPLGCAGMTVAILTNLVGGRRLTWLANGAIFAVAGLLILASLLLPALAEGRHPVPQVHALMPAIPLAWLLFIGAMVWLWRRGWRGLMQLPHPFVSV